MFARTEQRDVEGWKRVLAPLWSPGTAPLLQQLLGALCRAEHTWKPLWFSRWKSTALKAVPWLEMFVPVWVPTGWEAQSKRVRICLQRWGLEGAGGGKPLAGHRITKFTPKFYCSATAPQMLLSCMWYLTKIFLILSFFLSRFPCFPCHVVPTAEVTAAWLSHRQLTTHHERKACVLRK